MAEEQISLEEQEDLAVTDKETPEVIVEGEEPIVEEAAPEDFYKNPKKKKTAEEDEDGNTRAQRKKEYLKNKKQKKKKSAAPTYDSDSDDDFPSRSKQTDGFITGEEAAAQIAARVSYSEFAEAPPTFKQLPRGAKNKLKLRQRGVKTDDKGVKMDESKIKAEQNAMEIMRKKVIASYALLKAKRSQEARF